jgi:DNA-binding transcriptional LysR family regulator
MCLTMQDCFMAKRIQASEVWARLPAFRAIAECEHLPTAARMVHVTPPALSRTLRLLETSLGQPLFHRTGKRLVLNESGQALLEAVADAMQQVDTALQELEPGPPAGPIRIGTLGVLTDHVVLPALLKMVEDHPALEPQLVTALTSRANDLLAQGRLQIAFYYEALTDPRVTVRRVGETGAGVYCGTRHPLFAGPEPSLEDVLAWPFSVPQSGDSGRVMDGWPVDLPRRVAFQITSLSSNEAIALSGSFLTVLPDLVGRPHTASGRLRRLGAVSLPGIPIFSAWRAGEPTRTAAAVLNGVRQQLNSTTPAPLPPGAG